MKLSISLLTASLLALLVLAGCANPQKRSPEATAQAFLTELQQNDYEGAKQYCTPETRDKLNLYESVSSMGANPFGDDFTITRTDEDGQYARVYYTQGDAIEKMMRLRNTTGQWEILLSKNDLARGENDTEIDLNDEEMEELGENIGDAFEEMGKGLGRTMEKFGEGMQDMGENIEENVERRSSPGHLYQDYREDKSPEEVAEAFLTAMSYNDEKGAKRYASEQTADLLGLTMNGGSKYEDFEIKRTKLEGDYARVYYTLPEDRDAEQTLKLRKDTYGNWEVLMTKDDQPKKDRKRKRD